MKIASKAPASLIDAAHVREDFPLLVRGACGVRLHYLDSAATSQKPRAVLEVGRHFYENVNANIHRGAYRLAEAATRAYEGVRVHVARFLGLPDPRGVVFTSGTTESINLVAASWGRSNVKAGDEILLTEMEHHANLVPWIRLAEETGAVLRYIPIDANGRLVLDALDRLLTARTRLVSIIHASNVLGTVNPVDKIAARAHAIGALVLVDAAQSVPNRTVHIDELGADLIAFSAHKTCGPTGVGVLAARDPRFLDGLPPYKTGGEMIGEVHYDRATYREAPWRFEAGTPNIAGVVGLGAAIEYLESIGLDRIHAHARRMTALARERLDAIGGLRILGPEAGAERGDVLSFVDPNIHPHDMAQILDKEGVAVRAGHHCAQPLHRKLGITGSTRASFYLYNDDEDIDALARGIVAARKRFS